jgi:hypothetical protein
MMKSISDKAEVSLDFPDKAYMGSFGRESSFDVKVDPGGSSYPPCSKHP